MARIDPNKLDNSDVVAHAKETAEEADGAASFAADYVYHYDHADGQEQRDLELEFMIEEVRTQYWSAKKFLDLAEDTSVETAQKYLESWWRWSESETEALWEKKHDIQKCGECDEYFEKWDLTYHRPSKERLCDDCRFNYNN